MSLVHDLIEKSKLDNAIIVGSEIRAALAEPVGPDRMIDLNDNIYTIAEALAMWQQDIDESNARTKRIEELERELAEATEARHVLAGSVERLQGTGQQLSAARAEADALRAEVADLKGRKVTLPCNGIMRSHGTTWYLEELIVKAIRAAGIEVA